jgi:hypothetical protein
VTARVATNGREFSGERNKSAATTGYVALYPLFERRVSVRSKRVKPHEDVIEGDECLKSRGDKERDAREAARGE